MAGAFDEANGRVVAAGVEIDLFCIEVLPVARHTHGEQGGFDSSNSLDRYHVA